MVLDAGSRLLAATRDPRQLRLAPDPDAPAERLLAPGELRVAIEQLGLPPASPAPDWHTFPADDPGWGCLPAWGHARVSESRCVGVAVGTRLFGRWPLGTHFVLRPRDSGSAGLTDDRGRRYARRGSPSPLDAVEALLWPALRAACTQAARLAAAGYGGARQLLLPAAAGPRAFALAFCLRRQPGAPALLGVASRAESAEARELGCYDAVIDTEDLTRLDPRLPSAWMDTGGDDAWRQAARHHFGRHWVALSETGTARPDAAACAAAWSAFAARAADPLAPWLRLRSVQGAPAIEAAWRARLAGRDHPREGLLVRL